MAEGGLKGFFIDVIKAVLTSDEVKAMLQDMLDRAAQLPAKAISAEVEKLGEQVQSLEKSAIDGIDGLDGKMGNLPDQLLGPIERTIKPLADAIDKFGNLGGALGGMFGQR